MMVAWKPDGQLNDRDNTPPTERSHSVHGRVLVMLGHRRLKRLIGRYDPDHHKQ